MGDGIITHESLQGDNRIPDQGRIPTGAPGAMTNPALPVAETPSSTTATSNEVPPSTAPNPNPYGRTFEVQQGALGKIGFDEPKAVPAAKGISDESTKILPIVPPPITPPMRPSSGPKGSSGR